MQDIIRQTVGEVTLLRILKNTHPQHCSFIWGFLLCKIIILHYSAFNALLQVHRVCCIYIKHLYTLYAILLVTVDNTCATVTVILCVSLCLSLRTHTHTHRYMYICVFGIEILRLWTAFFALSNISGQT